MYINKDLDLLVPLTVYLLIASLVLIKGSQTIYLYLAEKILGFNKTLQPDSVKDYIVKQISYFQSIELVDLLLELVGLLWDFYGLKL